MLKLAFSVLVVVLVVGCHKNDNYCPGANPDDNCYEIDAGSDGPSACTTNAQCSAPTAVCDTAMKICVQCTTAEAQACTGATPVCGSDDMCRGCSAHTDCASSACLADGSCAAEGQVAYVDPAGADNNVCTKAMPCTLVSKALATGRPNVKFHGTTNEQVTINNQNVTILADPGAKLSETSPGVILKVDGTSVVTMYDLEVADGLGAGGIGISMPAGNTAKMALRRVRVTGNAGGGISIAGGEFDVVNSIVSTNGGGSSTLGGIKIDNISAAGTHRIEFTTISANIGPATINTGITCGTVLTPLTFSNNIVYANVVSGGGKQLGGSVNCSATYSDIGPDATSGTGNFNLDPLFVNAGTGNFHLTANSPAKDTADPTATLATDIDGDERPQGSGRDVGADEFRP